MSKKVCIVDYGIGNLYSVQRACMAVGMDVIITHDKSEIISSGALILPGVGAYKDAMDNLNKLDLISPIKEFAQSGKYLMGVCLGMQLMLEGSEEFGNQSGLEIINGYCKRFPEINNEGSKIKVPQIMWNSIYHPNGNFSQSSPLAEVKNNEFMYFVHSYHATGVPNENTLSYTNYDGVEYASAIIKDNVFAFQFHPEKSSVAGLKIYSTFNKIINQ